MICTIKSVKWFVVVYFCSVFLIKIKYTQESLLDAEKIVIVPMRYFCCGSYCFIFWRRIF